jgi:hypothetical protein
MTRRLLEVISVAAVLVGVTMMLALSTARVEGQSRPASAATSGNSSLSRTSWGEPDLQGIWTREVETPLERPARYGDRQFFTDEERAELDSVRAGAVFRHSADTRRNRGSEQDVGGAYNAEVFLSHLRTGRRTSLIVDPRDGKIPPFTPEAQNRRAAIRQFQLALIQATDVCKNKLPGCAGGKYGPASQKRAEAAPYYLTGAINRGDGPEDRSLGERCMGAVLPDFGGAAGFALQLAQSPGAVSIFYDTGQGQGWQRVIPVDGSPHLPPSIRMWWGDSRGHWEGNTLVVDVTNFSPKTDYQGSRENLHLVERWTRTDANTLEYTTTIEDPTTWVRPWTVTQELQKQSDQANRLYREPRCHEGNYGLLGLLAGTRAEERAFAEGTGRDPATLCTAGCGGFGGGFADEGEDANPLR